MSTSTARSDSRPLFAITLRLLAVALLTGMYAMVKVLEQRGVNLAELCFYRQLFSIPIIYAWVYNQLGPKGFATDRVGGHALRTIFGLTSMVLTFASVALLPLAESTTLGFTAPIFATILSAVILHEKTGIHRWSAVIIGFIGVLIMVQPGSGGNHFPPLGLAVGIAAAIGVSGVSIILRRLSRTEPSPVIVFWFSVLSLPPTGLLMFWYGQMHDIQTFVMIFVMATIGGIAQLLITSALRWGPVSIVLPMDYSSILWATLLGWLLWDNWPGLATWLGAVLIMGSGLYIVWREHKLGLVARLKAEADADMRA